MEKERRIKLNIFATSQCPKKSAEALDDKRVIKMALESTQLLCSALHSIGQDAPYKKTHENHPCTIWARSSRQNAYWLFDHGIALCKEYTRRFNKEHKCHDILRSIKDKLSMLPDTGFTDPPNCAKRADLGIDCTNIPDVYHAYNVYLLERMKRETANKRTVPRYGRKTMPHIVLKKIESNHDNLRTDEVTGFTVEMPKIGHSFTMFAKSLDGDSSAYRHIRTSEVISAVESGDETVFRTHNSIYSIKVIGGENVENQ